VQTTSKNDRRVATRHGISFHNYLLSDIPFGACRISIGTVGSTDIGYARVSTAKHDLDRQIEALRGEGIPARHIYVDKKSGSTTNRPRLHEALGQAREGDVIVVHTLDRLGRTVRDTLNPPNSQPAGPRVKPRRSTTHPPITTPDPPMTRRCSRALIDWGEQRLRRHNEHRGNAVTDDTTVAGGKAVLRLRPDGLLHLIWNPGVHVQPEDALSAVAMINRISPDRDRPLLVDMRASGNTSSGARDVFGVPHAASRIALLGESPVDRVIANFFTGVRRPQRPTRYFTSEEAAIAWLTEVRPPDVIPDRLSP